jgi:5-methyltetrahydrofolate--homocysteine methyltransferase
MATRIPTTAFTALTKLVQERIVLLDGGMGTMIQRHEPSEADFRGAEFANHPTPLQGNNDLLVMTQASIIEGIHRAYLEAGADIVETCTFNSNRISQVEYGLESQVYRLNKTGAEVARRAVDGFTERKCFVAGSIGPTSKTASMSPRVEDPAYREVSFGTLRDAYSEQVNGLLDGGADILLVETVFDTLNCKAALYAIENILDERGIQVPVMVPLTITGT